MRHRPSEELLSGLDAASSALVRNATKTIRLQNTQAFTALPTRASEFSPEYRNLSWARGQFVCAYRLSVDSDRPPQEVSLVVFITPDNDENLLFLFFDSLWLISFLFDCLVFWGKLFPLEETYSSGMVFEPNFIPPSTHSGEVGVATQWIGYRWLAEKYGVEPVQPYVVESEVGPTRKTLHHDGKLHQILPPVYRQDETVGAQLTFALKHEGVFLELLARLFGAIPERELVDWINDERTGQYSRRAGFLYEWLTGKELPDLKPLPTCGYVDAISADDYVVRSTSINVARWRVRDNLPGTRLFCPTVRRTNAVKSVEAYDCAQKLDELQAEYGADVLRRSAVWLTLKESRASFEIEHEQDKSDRIKRFAAVMESQIGEYARPLSVESLTELQHAIIGDLTTLKTFGLRKSPVFVGATEGFRDVIHYIAPHWDDVPGMIAGLESFLKITKDQSGHKVSPIVRATVAAFGFVYIHPFVDGNGRTHRFLINDVLRRDGAVPRPFVLPVSAAITSKAQTLAAYDQVLEVLSKPLMRKYEEFARFEQVTTYADHVRSNFSFTAYEQASYAWRYLDLTAHVEYLGDLIDHTIRTEMRNEAQMLQMWDQARLSVKEVLDGPNADIDRIVRSVRDNNWEVSNKLAKEFPVIGQANLGDAIVAAVKAAFDKA